MGDQFKVPSKISALLGHYLKKLNQAEIIAF